MDTELIPLRGQSLHLVLGEAWGCWGIGIGEVDGYFNIVFITDIYYSNSLVILSDCLRVYLAAALNYLKV